MCIQQEIPVTTNISTIKQRTTKPCAYFMGCIAGDLDPLTFMFAWPPWHLAITWHISQLKNLGLSVHTHWRVAIILPGPVALNWHDLMTWKWFLHYWPFVREIQPLQKLWEFYQTKDELGLILLIWNMIIWRRYGETCWTNSWVASDLRCHDTNVILL